MAEGTGDRQGNSTVDLATIAKAELTFGWCKSCQCELSYHLGSDSGECVYCNCPEYAEHPDSDLWDRLKGHLLPEAVIEDIEDFDIVPRDASVEIVDVIEKRAEGVTSTYVSVVFIGRASRSCKQCGEVKLYKEFHGSDDPKRLCNLCAEWQEQENLLEQLTEDELAEIEALEEDIIEAEYEYEDVWERQRMMDAVLRELDE